VAEIEDDIMGSYNQLIYLVIVITVVGLLVFFLLCRILIRRQMKPLRHLTDSAQQIAQGHYDKIIPDPQREDEIGQLEKHFQKMQISLASKSRELNRLKTQLTKHREDLRKAYGQAQGSDRMKTTFLHYMTTQMIEPADLIEKSITKLSNDYFGISPQEADYEVEVIKKQSEVVLDLLDHMVEALKIEAEEAEKEIKKGKEADHD
jgi:HAMP domain-containing protein